MDRKQFLDLMISGVIGLPFARSIPKTALAMDFRFEFIRPNAGFFSERGGTIGWLMENDGIVVVDAQFPEQAQNFIGELRKESVSEIVYLINTHHHGDHTSGNIAFRDLTGHILAHENSLKNQQNAARANNSEDRQLYPDMTYTTQWAADIGNEHITLDYWGPAHTDGDSIVHFTRANVVHMGDLVFNRRHPYIDKGAGASIENWIVILDKACAHFDDDALFLFGHARDGYEILGGKDDLRAFAHYLERVLMHVSTLLRAGKSDEEIMSETVIPGAEEWQGEGIQRSLDAALIELRVEK